MLSCGCVPVCVVGAVVLNRGVTGTATGKGKGKGEGETEIAERVRPDKATCNGN